MYNAHANAWVVRFLLSFNFSTMTQSPKRKRPKPIAKVLKVPIINS